MRDTWAKVLRFSLDCLGHPASLGHMLQQNRDLRFDLPGQPCSIASSEVVRWHEWGKGSYLTGNWRAPGELLGWKAVGTEFCSYHYTIDALANVGYTEIVESWECEIQDVQGLCASKSELRDFESLDAMAVARTQYLVGEITHANLEKSLGWYEIRILHRDSTDDFFACHQWDGRVFLMNSGGSHHFVAGRYLAARLEVPVPLKGLLRVHRLSQTAVSRLVGEYEVFALNDDSEAFQRFFDAMREYRAGFLWTPLPRHLDGRAVFLPRGDARAMRIVPLMRAAGHFDLGAHLQELSARPVRLPRIASARRQMEPVE